MSRKSKGLLATSDWHCGHKAGLTPPEFQWKTTEDDTPYRQKVSRLQKSVWDDFAGKVKEFRPIDTLLINGDAIDGKGYRNGGREILYPDRDIQCDMVESIVKFINPMQLVMVSGTPYHTGATEQWEKQAFNRLANKHIKKHDWGDHSYLDMNGCIVSCKHFVSSSSIPHGRATALLKDGMWNKLWAAAFEDHPKANVLIRAHTHSYMQTDDDSSVNFILPGLQAADTEFGKIKCCGTVKFGLVHMNYTPSGGFTWQKRTTTFLHAPVKPFVL